MRRTAYLGLSLALMMFVLVIAPAPAIFGQAPAMKSKAEYDAYNAAYTEKGPAKKAELSETFLNNFKDSDVSFRTNAYIMMVKGYADAQNFPKSMETASKVTEVVPNMAPDKQAQIYSIGMDSAAKSDNIPKVIEFGDKVLALVPEDANTLITLSSLIPERLPTDEAGKKAALDKAEQYATKAQAVMQSYVTQFLRMDSDEVEDQANLTVRFLGEHFRSVPEPAGCGVALLVLLFPTRRRR